MIKKAVLIGAGQIGRGFIGHVLHNAGYNLVFIDVSKKLVDEINLYKEYKIIVMGAELSEYIVDSISAKMPDDPTAAHTLLDAALITTAVGPSILPKVAPFIAEGILLRHKNGIKLPLDVIACENMDGGSSLLRGEVFKYIPTEASAYAEKYAGFPDAEVSRMVMPVIDENPLTVKVEK